MLFDLISCKDNTRFFIPSDLTPTETEFLKQSHKHPPLTNESSVLLWQYTQKATKAINQIVEPSILKGEELRKIYNIDDYKEFRISTAKKLLQEMDLLAKVVKFGALEFRPIFADQYPEIITLHYQLKKSIVSNCRSSAYLAVISAKNLVTSYCQRMKEKIVSSLRKGNKVNYRLLNRQIKKHNRTELIEHISLGKEARDILIRHSFQQIISNITKYRCSHLMMILFSEGLKGVESAIEDFRLEKTGGAFASYMDIRISSYIKDWLRKEEKDNLLLTRSKLKERKEALQKGIHLVIKDKKSFYEDKCVVSPDLVYQEKELENAVLEIMEKLTSREREVIDDYYYKDLDFKEIGKKLNLHESRICQIHTSIINKIKKDVNNNGLKINNFKDY